MPPTWTSIPTNLLDQFSMQDMADQWAKDQYAKLGDDWADQQQMSAPPSSDSLTNPLGTGNGPAAPPEPAAGASAPPSEPSVAAPPPAAPAPAASTTQFQPQADVQSSQISPPLADAQLTPPSSGDVLDRNGVINYVHQQAAKYGLDPAAVLAVANQEGLNTDPGSHWTLAGEKNISFGPPSWYGNGAGSAIIAQHGNDAARWSWTPEGIDYWLGQVAQAAKGLAGTQAIAAIVNGFERPREDLAAGEIKKAQAQYDTFARPTGDGSVSTASSSGAAPPPGPPDQGNNNPVGDFFSGLGTAAHNVGSAAVQAVSPGGAVFNAAGAPNAALTAGEQALSQHAIPEALQTIADLTQQYPDPRTKGLTPDIAAMTPEDQQRYASATIAVGGIVSSGANFDKYGVEEGFTPPAAKQVSSAGAPSPDLAAPETTRLEPEVAASIGEQPTPAAQPSTDTLQGLSNMAQQRGVQVDDWQTQLNNLRQTDAYQNASRGEQQSMVADAQAQFQAEQQAAAPAAEAPSNVATAAAPDVLDQATGKASGDLPPAAMQALREYAAAVGPDSNAALVEAQQSQRAAGQLGAEVNLGPVIANNKEAARATLDQKLAGLGLQGDPRVQQFIQNVETPSSVQNMPILGGLQRAQQEVKGVIFPLSMFHAYTEGLYSTLSRPSGAADFAKTFLSSGPTEAAQQTPMWLRAARAGVTHLFDAAAPDAQGVSSGLTGAAIRAGIGGVGGAAGGYTQSKISGDSDETAAVNALIYGLAGATGAVAAKPLISDNLWRAVQYSKVKTFESMVNSGVEDQVAAAAVNRTYGGLNYAQMGRSQTFQDLLRLTVQAPDWGESTIRQVGSAFFGGDSGAGFSRGLLARTVLGTAFATEIMNMAFTGHPSWENEPGHQFQVQLPEGTADKPVYIGIGPGNLQAYADLAAKISADPSKAITSDYRGQREPGDIPQFIGNRAAAIPASAYELASGNAFGGSKAPLVAEVAANAAPISVSTAVQAQHENMSPLAEALLLAAGANPRYGSAGGQRPIRPTRGAAQPGPLDLLSGLFKTGSTGRPARPTRK